MKAKPRLVRIVVSVASICVFLAGCTPRNPRNVIEKHLGLSPAGAKILDEALSHAQDDPPDVGLLLHRLGELEQDKNLSLGVFLLKSDPDLMVTDLITAADPASQCRAVLSNNTTSAGSTLVRPEGISNVVVETNRNGRAIGRFDWSVPGFLRGTSRFVIKGRKLEYLGVLRKHPVSTYDCETIFSRHGNMFASQQWIRTEYFAVIKPASERTKGLSRLAQTHALHALLRSRGINSVSWPLRDRTLPPVYSGQREDRDKAIAVLKDSADWDVTMSGRAVDHVLVEPLSDSIRRQITKQRDKE